MISIFTSGPAVSVGLGLKKNKLGERVRTANTARSGHLTKHHEIDNHVEAINGLRFDVELVNSDSNVMSNK